MPKVPVNLDDKKKSIFKYYLREMTPADPAKLAKINEVSGDPRDALAIQDRNDLFKPGNLPGEFGWWSMPDGTALIANQTFFPGLTGEMFDWWFAWHPIDRLRYAIWDPHDHFDVYLADRAKALDFSRSMRERHWGSVHYIWEDVGFGGIDLLRISFARPAELGYDESKIDTPACNALVCANVIVYGNDQMPDVPVVMTHFLRPAEDGSELRSRFWFGWQIIDGQPVKLLPEGMAIPAMAPIALLKHNVAEFGNLAAIIGDVYAEEKNHWI